MNTRRTRYLITMTYLDGYVEHSVMSRRADALKEGARIARTWKRLACVSVKDTCAFCGPQVLFDHTFPQQA